MTKRADVVEFYLAPDGWRWHRISPNGRILCDSGEAYATKGAVRRGAERALSGDVPIRWKDGVEP